MAGTPYGFLPIRKLGATVIPLNQYQIPSGYATALYKGTPVTMSGTGREIAVAAGGTMPIGVFAGFQFVDAWNRRFWSDYWPANLVTYGAVAADAMVWDDPDIIFRIQSDSNGLAAANVGALCDWVVGAGNAVTQIDGSYCTPGTNATTAKGLRIIGLADGWNAAQNGQNAYGAYADVEVMFASHILRGIPMASAAGGV